MTEGEGLGERVLRSEHRVVLPSASLEGVTRKRKPLTPQQLEERRKKVRGREGGREEGRRGGREGGREGEAQVCVLCSVKRTM